MPPDDQTTTQRQADDTQNRAPQNDGNQGQETRDQSQQNNGRQGTLAEQAGLDIKTVWPDKWREEMAGGDEKKLNLLKRYDTPAKWAASHFGLVQRISSGEFKAATPKPEGKDVPPEVVKAWRQERGLPTDVAEIKIPLPAKVSLDDLPEEAKERISTFTKSFFDADITQAQVEKIMGDYNAYAEKQANDQAVADAKLKDELEDTLRSEWGGEYRQNIAATDNFLNKTFGEDIADAIMGARTMDGRRLFNIPEFFKAVTGLARATGIDPVEGGEPQTGGKSVDARIAEINDILVKDRARYNREGLAEEKLKLLERKERAGGR